MPDLPVPSWLRQWFARSADDAPETTTQPPIVAAPVGSLAPVEQPVGSLAPVEQPVGALAPVEQPVGALAPVEQPVGALAPVEAPVGALAPVEAPVGALAPVEAPRAAPATTPAPASAPAPRGNFRDVMGVDLSEVRGLMGVLDALADGGEPLGPLVRPTRTSDDPAPTPAQKKPTRGKGSTATGQPATAGDGVDRRWPSGPLIGRDLFTADEVQRLVEAILMDEEILDHPATPGLTRERLRLVARQAGFEPHRFGRFSAALLVWFARAGVTVLEDDKARTAWARPRPIASRDRAEIRRMLQQADPPDGDAVAIARANGLDSSAP